jgi:hypothetical protein
MTKNLKNLVSVGLLLALTLVFNFSAAAQRARETYTGTILSYGSGFNTRTQSAPFTLNINGTTPDNEAQGLLEILQSSGQNSVLREIEKQDLGRFGLSTRVGVPINVVRESVVEGRRRIFIVFQRWTQFAELRGGYRSLDYPFGVVEMFIDERTGKGEGTYIAAARIRFDRDDRRIEIENFGTYPARLLGVQRRGR